MYVLCLPCGRKILMAQKNVLPFEISLILILFDIISDRFICFSGSIFLSFFSSREKIFSGSKKKLVNRQWNVVQKENRIVLLFSRCQKCRSQKYRYRISLHTVQLFFFYNLQFWSSVTAYKYSGLWTVCFLYKKIVFFWRRGDFKNDLSPRNVYLDIRRFLLWISPSLRRSRIDDKTVC